MKVTCFTSAITSFGLRTAQTSCAWRIALISLLAACGDGHRCVDDARTIEHGIYGEVALRTLEGGDTPLYQVKMSLMQDSSHVIAETESNADGLYEFALPKSTQSIPLSFALSSSMFPNAGRMGISVPDLVRLDLVVEEGQVFWVTDNFPDCRQ
jgi:hypothetical protein